MNCAKELGYVPPIRTDRDYSGPSTNNNDSEGAAAWNRQQQKNQEYENFMKQQARQREENIRKEQERYQQVKRNGYWA